MLAQNNTLRRPRTLFVLALTTLCVTLFFSFERIKLSAFSLFQEPYIPLPVNTHQSLLPLTDNEKQLYKSIFHDIGPMSYGTAHRPPIKGLPKNIIATLPDQLVPAVSAKEDGHVKRLILIGDVHGHKGPLQDLLDTLNFTPTNDALVFTGDLINKGPDSAGVVELAMKLGAHSVRGNHEDRVLLMHHALSAQSTLTDTETTIAALDKFQIKDDGDHGGQDRAAAHKEYLEAERKLSKGDERARDTARSLSSEQIKWLSELPVILRVGPIPHGADDPAFENLVVVHAGLVPSVALDDQDPWAVMNMRTISHPADALRHDAVRDFLVERAKRLPGGTRGKLAAVQAVDDSLVDQELRRIIQEQDPEDEMHEVSLPSSGRDGTYWYEEWSWLQEKLLKKEKKQEKKEKKKGKKGGKKHSKGEDLGPVTTVVYGHDAKSGLKVPEEYGKGKKGYTFGLDSGCVYGGKLTALVIEVKDDQAVHEIVQVDCEKYVASDE